MDYCSSGYSARRRLLQPHATRLCVPHLIRPRRWNEESSLIHHRHRVRVSGQRPGDDLFSRLLPSEIRWLLGGCICVVVPDVLVPITKLLAVSDFESYHTMDITQCKITVVCGFFRLGSQQPWR